MSLDPALAAVRSAVRQRLGIIPDGKGGVWAPDLGDTVLVACSGGADSLALLAATLFEVHKIPAKVIGVVVDHGLQEGSAEHTARVVEQMAALGADETATIRVTVDPGPAGVEAGAREARYAALSQLAEHFGAESVLLGHTLDDQAETVLLGLARGSGGRSLQGMRPAFWRDEEPIEPVVYGPDHDLTGSAPTSRLVSYQPRHSTSFRRPLLEITRAQTEAACLADGVTWWEDPQNGDPRFLRSRVRHTVLPMLERELGPGVAEALARTSEQLRSDMAELDGYAELAHQEAAVESGVDLAAIETVGPAIVTRVVRLAALEAGVIASELTHAHVMAVLRAGPGKEIQLPGHVTAYRSAATVLFKPTVMP